MSDNVYERVIQVLSWKRIIAFNLVLFLVLVVPLSVRLAEQDTENRSSASDGNPVPSVTPPPSYPAEAPRIERVSEFFGKAGDTVVVIGQNFGEYQWGSKVYLGNVEAQDSDIVSWSNNILEVQIPQGARTGQVYVVVNGQRSSWEGSLLLVDVARAAQVGLKKEGGQVIMWITNGAGIVRGTVEIGHNFELGQVRGISPVTISSQNSVTDSLGRKTKLEIGLSFDLSSSTSNLLEFDYPGLGKAEILRVELYDANSRLVSVYSDPLNIKVN